MPLAPTQHWTAIDWSVHERERAIGGRTVRYVDYGEGPPLVLLHGMGGCWQWWLELLPDLGRHHRTIAVDLPGFGASTPLPPPAAIAAHAQVVQELLADLGVHRAHVLGHSMGGLVAIALATDHPDAVEKLVLVGAGGVPMSERRLGVILKILRGTYWAMTRGTLLERLASDPRARTRWLRMAFRDPGCLSPELAREVIPRIAAPGFLDSIAASARAVRSTRADLIAAPTLLLWGARDAFAPLHAAFSMLDVLPDGRIEVIPEVGHSPMIEAPQRFLDLLLPFTTGSAR